MKSSRTRRGAVIAAALTLALVGCSSGGDEPNIPAAPQGPVSPEWQAVIDAANDEGRVTWYSVSPPAAREALKEAFEAAYPEISVEIRAISGAEMDAALETEHDTGTPGADVVSAVNYAWADERSNADDWFAPITGPSFEHQDWVDSGYIVNGNMVMAPIGLVVIGWNTQLFPEQITGYEDLLDPRLKGGALGMIEPYAAVFSDWWSFIEEHHDADFLERMADQDPTFYPSAAVMNESIASGEIAVGGFATAVDLAQLKEDGAPVDFMVPDPAWTAQNLFYVPQSAGNPNAAQVFMDFFASPAGQAAVAEFGATPLKEVAPDTLGANTPIVLTTMEHVLDPNWTSEYEANWRTIFSR
ncbi:MAG: extracellular solute-binding protein [Salinibacterium sp.]|nr:extracellular solute-binding protein [Salinibacterium sp.]MBF0673366.1 extracellular solute-binding protein [Salinibacterium sp.]